MLIKPSLVFDLLASYINRIHFEFGTKILPNIGEYKLFLIFILILKVIRTLVWIIDINY